MLSVSFRYDVDCWSRRWNNSGNNYRNNAGESDRCGYNRCSTGHGTTDFGRKCSDNNGRHSGTDNCGSFSTDYGCSNWYADI